MTRHPSGPIARIRDGTDGPRQIKPSDEPATAMPGASPLFRRDVHAASMPMTGTLLAPLPAPTTARAAIASVTLRARPVGTMPTATHTRPAVMTRRGPGWRSGFGSTGSSPVVAQRHSSPIPLRKDPIFEILWLINAGRYSDGSCVVQGEGLRVQEGHGPPGLPPEPGNLNPEPLQPQQPSIRYRTSLTHLLKELTTNLDYAPEFFRLLSWSGIRKDSGVRAGTVRRRPEFLRIPLRD